MDWKGNTILDILLRNIQVCRNLNRVKECAMLLLGEETAGRGNINYKDLLEGMNLFQSRKARDAQATLAEVGLGEVGSS